MTFALSALVHTSWTATPVDGVACSYCQLIRLKLPISDELDSELISKTNASCRNTHVCAHTHTHVIISTP